ncbi:MAG: CoA transferase [Cellulosilyticaceae bacterium]
MSTSTVKERADAASQDIEVDINDAIHQLMAAFLTDVNGVGIKKLTEDVHLLANSDFYQAADGRYVFLLTSYPHLRDKACKVLNCPPLHEDFEKAVKGWKAFDLEEAINEIGGTCIAVRTQEEWRNHPQGKLLNESPVVSIEKVGDSEPRPFSTLKNNETLPLKDLRVIDNTHVIAGPVAARLFAELGSEVVHISSPKYPDPIGMIVETNIGKKSAYCDIDNQEDFNQLKALLKETDVFVNNYLSIERKGLSVEEIASISPGIVILDYHGWGADGPWHNRGGFDQLACSATGFSAEEGGFDHPSLPPTYLLNDYLAAIVGAAGAIEALRRRAQDGGSYRVHVDLARICMWIQDLGMFAYDEVAHLPRPTIEEGRKHLVTVPGAFGETSYLPIQIKYSSITPCLEKGAEPLGASALTFN